MDYTKIIRDLSGIYNYEEASNVEMEILGFFFSSDVGFYGVSSFRGWALDSIDGEGASGNTTDLEREMDDILITYQFSAEPVPAELRMTARQLIDLLDEWQEKVVDKRPRPNTVMIKHENGLFWMETSDE